MNGFSEADLVGGLAFVLGVTVVGLTTVHVSLPDPYRSLDPPPLDQPGRTYTCYCWTEPVDVRIGESGEAVVSVRSRPRSRPQSRSQPVARSRTAPWLGAPAPTVIPLPHGSAHCREAVRCRVDEDPAR